MVGCCVEVLLFTSFVTWVRVNPLQVNGTTFRLVKLVPLANTERDAYSQVPPRSFID